MDELREKIRIRQETEKTADLYRAQRTMTTALNKAKEALRVLGVQARKDNRARKERLREHTKNNTLPAAEDLLNIREPDKDPDVFQALSITPEGHLELLHIIQQLQKALNGGLEVEIDIRDRGEVSIMTGDEFRRVERADKGVLYIESSPPRPKYIESSDVESDAGSVDSIRRNANFIAF